jgi:mevalonate kinase
MHTPPTKKQPATQHAKRGGRGATSRSAVSYSAPAKIILCGEHAVVYGKPALICALDLRLTVSITPSSNTYADDQLKYVATKVIEYLTRKNIPLTSVGGYRASIRSQIPSGRNLGSSAAFSVAAAAAFLHFYTGVESGREMINAVAYEVEKRFHGNPSGADNSTSCFGGLIYYRKEFEFLKHISALNAKLPQIFVDHLFIVQTGKPKESTADMVAAVGRAYNEDPTRIEGAMNLIEKATKKMTLAVTGENADMCRDAIVENEAQLEVLGVVSQRTKMLLAQLAPYGVGKVTGGGGRAAGSGNVLFFAYEPLVAAQYFDKNNISYLRFVQDYQGVKKES